VIKLSEKRQEEKECNEKPAVYIHRKDWEKICKAAEIKDRKIKAFALYCKRGKGTPYIVSECRPIKVIEDKPGIFHYVGMVYPDKGSKERFAGTIVIRPDLDITPHYAYWMGVGDYDFTINLRMGKDGKPEYKAYWVHRQKTHGEFIEIDVHILT